MKKLNGYGWIIQLVIFIFAIIYFLGYRDNQLYAEMDQRIDLKMETIEKDVITIKYNLKRSLEEQEITWTE